MGKDTFKPPAFRLAATYTGARTYYLKVDKPLGGWALCTVNDKTGELIVVSDWGNWAYRWDASPANLGGRTFTEFLAGRMPTWTEKNGEIFFDSYIANKLTTRADREAFDDQATADALCHLIAERRLADGRKLADRKPQFAWAGNPTGYENRTVLLDKESARDLFDAIQNLVGTAGSCDGSSDLFLTYLMQTLREHDVERFQYLLDEPWNHLEYKPTYPYLILQQAILPALIAACKATVAEFAAIAAVPAHDCDNEDCQRCHHVNARSSGAV